ncbi:MAG TPA: ORF6N domain-containing protein [Opitutaceae bacterium]|jgi:hypothetical protein|nr:ORF6N domain-containing protein [Opitutaceae bacterium]
MTKPASLIIPPVIDAHIQTVRGRRVMMDSDLAKLYGVPTKALNQAVQRNRERFPADFMFQLTAKELANLKCQTGVSNSLSYESKGVTNLRSQIVTSSLVSGGRRYLPYVFTQEGVAMLSSVLRSPRAVAVNIEIVRAFVRLRRLTLSVKELATKITDLEKKYDGQFGLVFEAIKELMAPPGEDDGVIGFLGKPKKAKSP